MSNLIPRLSQHELDPKLASLLNPRVKRLGYLGEFFQCAGHQPAALISFLNFTEDLKVALPANLTEIVALTVAKLMSSAYEQVQHERLCLNSGLPEKWVRQVLALDSSMDKGLSQSEFLVQRLVIVVVKQWGQNSTQELEAVVQSIGPPQTMAILMLVGRYVTHALIVNSLNLKPPISSPLENNQ
jgi:alkylhydroperoxidase family enzyme